MTNQKTIYLDYAAATPLDPEVAKLMAPLASEQFYNPSATYLAAVMYGKPLRTLAEESPTGLVVTQVR